MYNSFIEKFNSDLDESFLSYKSEGIEDIIIALRYNSGGDVPAEKHFANLIAPKDTEGEVFSIDHWNNLLTDYLTEKYGQKYFYSYIENVSANIDLKGKLIALTTNTTASASKGLLNGLNPLLNLTTIGNNTTHKKYTGMIVIPDDDNPEWALIPVVVKTTNKVSLS